MKGVRGKVVMPTLLKFPKDMIELVANDLFDWQNVKQRWELNGWLISSDYKDHIYSAVALKDSRVIVCLYEEPHEEPTPEPAAAATGPTPEPAAQPLDQGMDDIAIEEAAATKVALEGMGH